MEKAVVAFVCGMCKKISLMDNNTWDSSSNVPPKGQSSDVLSPFQPDITRWPLYLKFCAYLTATESVDFPKFPLCEQCLEQMTQHLMRTVELVQQFGDDAPRTSQEMADMVTSAKENANSKCFWETPVQSSSVSERKRGHVSSHIYARPVEETYVARPLITRRPTRRMTQLQAFHFDIVGLFATVNGLKLGRLRENRVPASEVNSALYLLCQFLSYQLKGAGVDETGMKLGAKIEFLTSSGVKEMRIPERSKEVDTFNLCVIQMMSMFNGLFISQTIQRMRPSNLIDVNKKTINSKSFLYSKKEPENFAKAMRKLVTNLKMIQAFQLMSD